MSIVCWIIPLQVKTSVCDNETWVTTTVVRKVQMRMEQKSLIEYHCQWYL